MEYRKFGNRYLIRMDPGEEILEQVIAICETEHILLGEFRGLGAADHLELGAYDVTDRKYYGTAYDGVYEITSLFGTISENDGHVYLHAHLSASEKNGTAVGGHLQKAVISGTCELVIVPMEGHVGRKQNPKTGLNDLEFDR